MMTLYQGPTKFVEAEQYTGTNDYSQLKKFVEFVQSGFGYEVVFPANGGSLIVITGLGKSTPVRPSQYVIRSDYGFLKVLDAADFEAGFVPAPDGIPIEAIGRQKLINDQLKKRLLHQKRLKITALALCLSTILVHWIIWRIFT